MRWKLLHEVEGQRTFVVVCQTDDEAVSTLEAFACDQGIAGARFTAIGGFRNAILGYFDWRDRQYHPIPVLEQVEVLSITGDVARAGDRPKVHAHAVLGRRDGQALGGHLIEGHVRPTLELVLVETPTHLVRVHDAASGLALIDPSRDA